MSFMAAAGAIGLTGLGATIGAGAMMGATVGGVGNLIQGRGLFDNLGQNLLVGGAGAGIMSGIGSLAGGSTIAEQEAAQLLAQQQSEMLKTGAENISSIPVEGMSTPAGKSPYLTTPNTVPEIPQNFTPAPEEFLNSMKPVAPSTPTDVSKFTQPSAIKPATLMKNPADWLAQNPSTAAGAVTGLAGMFKQPTAAAPAKPPGGDKYDYAYKPAQYGPDGKLVSQASYGTPTVTHYAAGGSIPGFADGVYIPQSKSIRTNIYGSNAGPIGESGRQMYKNTDKYAGLKAQLDRMSPTMLSRLSQGGTDSIVQAAATTELYDRANTANTSYIDQPTMQAAQGGIMGFDIGGSVTAGSAPVTNGGQSRWYDLLTGGISGGSSSLGGFDQLFSANPALSAQLKGSDKYSYNPANQSYSGGQSAGVDFAAPAQYSYDPSGQNFTKKMAQGGIASLPNEYAAGGKLLQGPGDGMSDSIPAVIKGPRPQRAALAEGEFVIPADVVSHLGNGSTDAGSKRLYAMMDKIRHARTGTKKQGKQIDPNHFLPA